MSRLAKDLKDACTERTKHYANTIIGRGFPSYCTLKTSNYEPYTPLREYDNQVEQVKRLLNQPIDLPTLVSVLAYVLNFTFATDWTQWPGLVDMSLINEIMEKIEKQPSEKVQQAIKSDPDFQNGLMRLLTVDASLANNYPKMGLGSESYGLFNTQNQKFSDTVHRFWPYVDVSYLHLMTGEKYFSPSAFHQFSDAMRNFVKRKMKELKCSDIDIYPHFNNSQQFLIYLKKIKSNNPARNIAVIERKKCLDNFQREITTKAIEPSSNSLRYLTLLEACREQTLNMLNDPKLKNSKKINLITDFGKKLDLLYKELNEKGAINPEQLFAEIIGIRSTLKDMQKSNFLSRSRSTAEKNFDKYFGSFFQLFKLDYFGGKDVCILDHFPHQKQISSDPKDLKLSAQQKIQPSSNPDALAPAQGLNELKSNNHKQSPNKKQEEDNKKFEILTSSLDPEILALEQRLSELKSTDDHKQLPDRKQEEEDEKELTLVKDGFPSIDWNKVKLPPSDLVPSPSIGSGGIKSPASDLVLSDSKQQSRGVLGLNFDGGLTSSAQLMAYFATSKNIQKIPGFLLFEDKFDEILTPQAYVHLSKLDSENSKPTKVSPRRADVLNLVANSFSFKKEFSSPNTSAELDVLKKLLNLDYGADGYLTEQGAKQFTDFLMLEIIKSEKPSQTLFSKGGIYQRFTERAGMKFTKVLREVISLYAIYEKQKTIVAQQADPINYLRTVQQSQPSQNVSSFSV